MRGTRKSERGMRRWSWMIVLVMAACGGGGQAGKDFGGADVPVDRDVVLELPALDEGGDAEDAPQWDASRDLGQDAGHEVGEDDSGDDPGNDSGSVDPGSVDPGTEDPGTEDPGVTDPGASDPGEGDPGTADPGGSDPGAEDPGANEDPGATDPGATDPGSVDPGAVDPGPTDPGPVDPGPLDPGTPDPGPVDPGPMDPGTIDNGTVCDDPVVGRFLAPAWAGGPWPNATSWDGAWSPTVFPIPGLFDNEYGDGHLSGGTPTPILPPGKWDWVDADNDQANWRNFYTNKGEFLKLKDGCGRQFGWKFVSKLDYVDAIDFAGPAEYLEGSAGTDLLLLGTEGAIHSIAGSMAGGPDVLVFGKSFSLDYRTGASGDLNAANDDDLVIAGCVMDAGTTYPIYTTTVHTGPGADVVFARNLRASAVDAGNGAGGRTDTLDPLDGDDLVVLGGNVKDVRFFGGRGNDTLVWYTDQMNEKTAFQGGDFFGGGGAGDALWGDPGTDRLVYVIPTTTSLVKVPQDPATTNFLLVMRENAGGGVDDPIWDQPTVNDPYAKYCSTCGTGPGDQHTLFVQYVSADGRVNTGYVSVTAFEELQVGIGPAAQVYRLDQVNGRLILASDLSPVTPPPFPLEWCAMR